jgi:hypothetical protein
MKKSVNHILLKKTAKNVEHVASRDQHHFSKIKKKYVETHNSP